MGLASVTLQADSADMLPMFMPAELEPISRDTATEITEIRDHSARTLTAIITVYTILTIQYYHYTRLFITIKRLPQSRTCHPTTYMSTTAQYINGLQHLGNQASPFVDFIIIL